MCSDGVKSKIWRTSTTVLDQFDYTYDRVSNRLTRDIPDTLYGTDDQDQVYDYDAMNRLIDFDEGKIASGSISSPTEEQIWTHDALGNWVSLTNKTSGSTTQSQIRTHDEANEITDIAKISGSVTWTDPIHDDAGNMTNIPKPTGLNGAHSAVYDAWHRLVSLDSGYTVNYAYDGLNRRISKDLYSGTDQHYFYNTKWQCVEVRDSSETGTTSEEYVWHPHYVDSLAVRYWKSNGDTDYNDTGRNRVCVSRRQLQRYGARSDRQYGY